MTKTKGRRAQQKEETRKLIIETACTLFSERGFDKTTIRAIAQKAGIAVGTLFVHFPDKPALLAATLYEDIEQVLQTAMATVPADALIMEKLLHLAQSLYLHHAQNRSLARVLIKETLFMRGEWGDAFQAQSMTFVDNVTTLLTAAQANGEIAANANCQLTATAFFSHYFMILITGLRDDTLTPDEQVLLLSQLMQLVLKLE